ncbi:MAG: BatD family protein [Pseudomonadota bacterium]
MRRVGGQPLSQDVSASRSVRTRTTLASRTARTAHVALVALVALLPAIAQAQPIELTLKVAPQRGRVQDDFVATVRMTIRGVNSPERYRDPQFGELTVLDQQSQQSTQWSYDPTRGQEIRNVEVKRYRLRANRAGRLRIEPARMRLDGREYETNSLVVEVHAAAAQDLAPAGEPDRASDQQMHAAAPPGFTPPESTRTEPTFLHVAVDRLRVMAGEQVTISWLLYTRTEILKFEPKVPRFDGFWVENLYEPRGYFTYHEEVVGGRTYTVAMVAKRALFPTSAGRMTVPPFEADVSTMHTSFGAPLHLASAAVGIEALPLPPGAPPAFDPAYVGLFSSEMSVDRSTVAAGESVTVTLAVRGAGPIRRTPIPRLSFDGFRVNVPQDFEEKMDSSTDLVSGERRYRYLLTPTRSGTLTVGPVEIPYFDPGEGKFRTARALPLSVRVIGEIAAGSQSGSKDNVIGKQTRPIREPPGMVARAAVRAYQTRWFRVLLAVPGLVFASVLLFDKLLERMRRETPRSRLRRIRGRARKRMRVADQHVRGGRAADYFGEISRVLTDHVEEMVGRPVAALTRDQLGELLANRGFSAETVEALVRELENCDFARFAPGASGPGEMRAATRRVRALLAAIERVRPSSVTKEKREG